MPNLSICRQVGRGFSKARIDFFFSRYFADLLSPSETAAAKITCKNRRGVIDVNGVEVEEQGIAVAEDVFPGHGFDFYGRLRRVGSIITRMWQI